MEENVDTANPDGNKITEENQENDPRTKFFKLNPVQIELYTGYPSVPSDPGNLLMLQ